MAVVTSSVPRGACTVRTGGGSPTRCSSVRAPGRTAAGRRGGPTREGPGSEARRGVAGTVRRACEGRLRTRSCPAAGIDSGVGGVGEAVALAAGEGVVFAGVALRAAGLVARRRAGLAGVAETAFAASALATVAG